MASFERDYDGDWQGISFSLIHKFCDQHEKLELPPFGTGQSVMCLELGWIPWGTSS